MSTNPKTTSSSNRPTHKAIDRAVTALAQALATVVAGLDNTTVGFKAGKDLES